MEFEWNPEKARSNEQKHGVSFYEAMTVFNDPAAYSFLDPDHSFDEDHYIVTQVATCGRQECCSGKV